MQENFENIAERLETLDLLHNTPGLLHQRIARCKAYNCLKSKELEAIYHMANSHAPQLRRCSTLCYLKDSNKNNVPPVVKDKLHIKCSMEHEGVTEMLRIIEEMPKEWTIVQLTSAFNPPEFVNIDKTRFETNPIHISVFKCGEKGSKPLLMTVDTPKDKVNGKKIELADEMAAIIAGNKEALMFTPGIRKFSNVNEKKEYINRRQDIESRLVSVIKDIQNLWLKEWRCLLSGKYVDDKLDIKLRKQIFEFFDSNVQNNALPANAKELFFYIVKGSPHLKPKEIRNAVKHCLGNSTSDDIIKEAELLVNNLRDRFSLHEEKKHPLILVLDDELDCIPWEMLNILENEPVTRVPSLYFVYSLFKSHEQSIVNGHKIIKEYKKGAYVINPDKDLKDMEIRIMQFLNYWLPEWTGISGHKPTNDEFCNLLTTSEIFTYNGHGSGAHLVSSKKIYESCVNAVVLLFGCGSTKISRIGPQTDMTSAYHMYLTARCPCVVGMLWEVTDIDTDILTTEFMSLWLPSDAPIHWTGVDKSKWRRAEEKVEFVMDKVIQPTSIKKNESELLRALVSAKKFSKYNGTKAACVARGLPVKIVQTKNSK